MLTPRDEALQRYFYFLQERMSIFRHRYHGDPAPYTDDPIFLAHKFTNVYRVLDRVSQYLIKHVIYNASLSGEPLDILLRIVIFKIFNTVPTREFLQRECGDITIQRFDPIKLSALLTTRKKTDTLFNGAYIMTGSHGEYDAYQYKHEKWLHMVDRELIRG